MSTLKRPSLKPVSGKPLRYVEQRLELLDQLPLFHANVIPIEFLEGVYALPRYKRIQRVFLF